MPIIIIDNNTIEEVKMVTAEKRTRLDKRVLKADKERYKAQKIAIQAKIDAIDIDLAKFD